MEADKIAVAIRTARLKAGLTQSQVANALGKSRTTVAAWESGRAQPDSKTIVALSELFGTSSDYLLGLSETRCKRWDDALSSIFGDSFNKEELSEAVEAVSSFMSSMQLFFKRVVEISPDLIEPSVNCLTSTTKAITELLDLYNTYSGGYSLAKRVSNFNLRFNELSDNLRKKILKSSDESAALLEEFEKYEQMMKQVDPHTFASEAIKKIDNTSNDELAVLALRLQIMVNQASEGIYPKAQSEQ